jgi:hypothetical protein
MPIKPPETHSADPVHREAVKPFFDAEYYLAANPDVRASGIDPLDHFLLWGWREGRNPSKTFDSAFYLSRYPDIASAGINPLQHYAWNGKAEGRQTRRALDAVRRTLEGSLAPRDAAPHWAEGADHSPTIAPSVLATALSRAPGREGLVLSVSHDDYVTNFGGIQNLIAQEQRDFELEGWSYLHASPASPLPMLAEPVSASTFRLCLRLNGEMVGAVLLQDLAKALATLRDERRLELVLHHLMGHAPELVIQLAEAAGVRPTVWLHDFFTICPNYVLMRNGVTFCGGPQADSAACTICVWGPDRLNHLPRVHGFFEATRPQILAPSRSALDLWLRKGRLPHAAAEILPLARLAMAEVDTEHAQPARAGEALRVCHVGAPVMHKGWPVFEELAMRLAADTRYGFYQIGIPGDSPLPGCIRGIPIRVSPEQPDAMIEAIAEHRIDVALVWSLWPETFCFVAHEALAGGAYVVGRAAAGNVWPAVAANAPAQGCVVENEPELFRLFESGEILRLVAESTRRRGVLLDRRSTADWLRRGRAPKLRLAGPDMDRREEAPIIA